MEALILIVLLMMAVGTSPALPYNIYRGYSPMYPPLRSHSTCIHAGGCKVFSD